MQPTYSPIDGMCRTVFVKRSATSVQYTLGWAEKWKNDILKYAEVDYYGTIYIKQGSIEKRRILKF